MRTSEIRVVVVSAGLLHCTERGEVLTPTLPNNDASSSAVAMDVSNGDRHSGAIANGKAYFWGANDFGQLGQGDTQNRIVPTAITGDVSYRQLAAGAEHSCGLDTIGRVYCWGGNERGQLGQGDRTARGSPTEVPLPAPATQVSAKFKHTCALLIDASLYCWGQNKEGQLGQADLPPTGDETLADGLAPVRIGSASWRVVDTGDGHTCAIQLDGGLWCWGRNSESELGGDTRIQVREPIQVNAGSLWLDVAAGQNYTCAVMQDFTLWCWGQNIGSETNDGSPLGIAGATLLQSPTRVGTAADWTSIHTNTFHTCALNRAAEMWCWGRNIEGQLGLADLQLRAEPTRVATGVSIASVGRFTTCMISDQGGTSCAGENSDGELGTGDLERRSTFAPVSGLLAR